MKKNVQNKNYRRGWRLLAVIGMLLCLPLLQLKAHGTFVFFLLFILN